MRDAANILITANGQHLAKTADNAKPDSGTDTDSSANILASADQILSSAEILADLARVRAVFQLRTIELILKGDRK